MKSVLCFSLLLTTLSGCSMQQTAVPAKPGLTALDAIVLSEQSAPAPVLGLFSLQIHNAEKLGSTVYLNTEYNYRDRRNVSIVLTPKMLEEFALLYPEQQSEQYFLGRTIVVNGAATRQTICFYSQGKKTDKYYFQTHIPVYLTGQILSPLTADVYWKQNKKAAEHTEPHAIDTAEKSEN